MTSLEDLGPGDDVVLVYGRGSRTVLAIERVTATQIVTSRGRYNRRTGRAVGGEPSGHNVNFLVEPQEGEAAELREASRRRKLVSAISDWSSGEVLRLLSTDQLTRLHEAFKSILDEARG